VKFWQGAIDSGLRGLRITTVEAEGRVDSGTEVSTYEALDKDGNVIDRGKALVIWKVESGTWRIWRDLWNTSVSTAPSVAPKPPETK
jgi:ketosteroid isomerase-like protein